MYLTLYFPNEYIIQSLAEAFKVDLVIIPVITFIIIIVNSSHHKYMLVIGSPHNSQAWPVNNSGAIAETTHEYKALFLDPFPI